MHDVVREDVGLIAAALHPRSVLVDPGVEQGVRGRQRRADAVPPIELGPRAARLPAVEVLAGQHRPVAGVVERLGDRGAIERDRVRVDARVMFEQARQDLRAGGTAERGVHVRALEQDPLIDEVPIRARHEVTRERGPRLVVAHQQQDVRTRRRCRRSRRVRPGRRTSGRGACDRRCQQRHGAADQSPQPVASRHPQTGYRLGASEPRVPPSLGVAGWPVNDLPSAAS